MNGIRRVSEGSQAPMSLFGKAAIVTGGGGNIGAATALLLASRGARVMVADVDLGKAEEVVTRILGAGFAAAALQFDLREEGEIRSLIERTVSTFGGLDILHNNAADLSGDSLAQDQDVETMDVSRWDESFAVNVRGTMLCCKYALQVMRRQAGAAIINMASNLALQGHIVQVAYSSSKAAIIQMTRSIAASHGRYGVRCNSVSPGLTLTPGMEGRFPEKVVQAIKAETLTGRLGDVNDIASVVAFLASDEARHITGQNIVVDGGNSSHVPGFANLHESF